ncbi:MAG: hypothetical protein MJ006_00155 [Methanocorpusculum sp.]|nr:hypothetical protein [Methanocorpusculum sp.]
MKDLSSRRFPVSFSNPSPRVLLIGFLLLMLIGLVIILILFSGGSSMGADDTVYIDGSLKTIVTYGEDTPQDYWVQYKIYREGGFLSREQIGELYSYIMTFKKGPNVTEYKIPLQKGDYQVFIYISTVEEHPKRVTGFIHPVTI